MESFDVIFNRIVSKYDLAKKQIAFEIGRSQSYISKIGKLSGKIKILPNEALFSKLVVFLKKSGVDEENLKELRDAFKSEWVEKRNSKITLHPIAITVDKALNDLIDSKASEELVTDIGLMINSYNQIIHLKNQFSSGGKTFVETEKELSNLINDLENLLGASQLANLYLEIGNQQRYQGKVKEAEISFYSAIKKIQLIEPEKSRVEANILIELADLYRRMEPGVDGWRWNKSIDLYTKSGGILKKYNGPIEESNSERRISSVWVFAGNPKNGELHAKISYDIARNCFEKKNVSKHEKEIYQVALQKALEHLAWTQIFIGDFDKAERYQSQALSIINQRKERGIISPRELAKSRRYEADILQIFSKHKQAEKAYIDVFKLIREMRTKPGEQNLDNLSIDTIIEQELADKEVFKETERILKGMTLLGLGQLYIKNPTKIYKGIDLIKKSIKINFSIQDHLAVGLGHMFLGKALRKIGNTYEANNFYLRAEQTFKSSGLTPSKLLDSQTINPYWLLILELEMGELDFMKGDAQTALSRIEKTLLWANEGLEPGMRLPSILVQAYLLRAKIAMSEKSKSQLPIIRNYLNLAISEAKKASCMLYKQTISQIKDQHKTFRRIESEIDEKLEQLIEGMIENHEN